MKKKFRFAAGILCALLILSTIGCAKEEEYPRIAFDSGTGALAVAPEEFEKLETYVKWGATEVVVVEITGEWETKTLVADLSGNTSYIHYSDILFRKAKVKTVVSGDLVQEGEEIWLHFGGLSIAGEAVNAIKTGQKFFIFGGEYDGEVMKDSELPVLSAATAVMSYVTAGGTLSPLSECKAMDRFTGKILEEATPLVKSALEKRNK